MADFQNAMCNGEMLKCLFKLFSGQCGVGAQHFTASQYYFAINKLICQQRMFGIVGDQTQFFHFAEQWNDLTADCPMSKK